VRNEEKPTAEDLIRLLDLKPLPREGGFYRETYRSTVRHSAAKSACTAMYYLLTPDTFSALHRLPTDEVFHFYVGDPVEMLLLESGKPATRITLGPDLVAGHQPQFVVPRGVWQGSRLKPGGAWALLGTTVAPGFDFTDYEGTDARELAAQFPEHEELIRALVRVKV
jgi:predicted cupin superfamily sugar epimerase